MSRIVPFTNEEEVAELASQSTAGRWSPTPLRLRPPELINIEDDDDEFDTTAKQLQRLPPSFLDDTLVVWGGEFGRTPVSENGSGRDHNPHGFLMWLAGGGVRGGLAHGATDEFGFRAERDRMHIHDLHATLLHLLGIDHERLTYRHAGRDYRLTDVHGRVAHEIIA